MAEKPASKADQVRALRESRADRRSNPRAKPESKQGATTTRSPAPSRYKTTGSRLPAGRTADAGEAKRDATPAPILKRGRPKITGPRPWQLAGMSRRSWYRRQKDAKS